MALFEPLASNVLQSVPVAGPSSVNKFNTPEEQVTHPLVVRQLCRPSDKSEQYCSLLTSVGRLTSRKLSGDLSLSAIGDPARFLAWLSPIAITLTDTTDLEPEFERGKVESDERSSDQSK
jgi:hypothetical protein